MTKITLKSLNEKIVELEAQIVSLTSKFEERRGPKSSRQMTEDDALRISVGDLRSSSHKQCAKELELSYGQIYSARNGFTFKHVYKQAQQEVEV